jgi:hypothetical protein
MRRPVLIGAALVVGLALLVTWIARNTYWDDITVPRFLRGEAATNPFYAVQRFVEALDVETEWRRSMGELPSTDSVLMLTHWNWGLIESRRKEIERWVENGGRLLLDATLVGGEQAFSEWSGLSTEYDFEKMEASDAGEQFSFTEPCRELELTLGRAQSDPSRSSYEVCGLETSSWINVAKSPEWVLEDDEGVQAVRVAIGRGKVILINGEPFSTRAMLEANNGTLFVDATLLRRGDHVVFLSEEDHPSILTLAWMHGAPAVLLGLAFVALALWRNSVRFGPLEAPPEISRRSLGEQIRGTGQFVFRTDGGRPLHAAMVRALHETARLRIPSYESLSLDDRIAAIAHLTLVDSDSLAETIKFNGSRNHHEFKQAIARLDLARARLWAYDASRASRRDSTAQPENA